MYSYGATGEVGDATGGGLYAELAAESDLKRVVEPKADG